MRKLKNWSINWIFHYKHMRKKLHCLTRLRSNDYKYPWHVSKWPVKKCWFVMLDVFSVRYSDITFSFCESIGCIYDCVVLIVLRLPNQVCKLWKYPMPLLSSYQGWVPSDWLSPNIFFYYFNDPLAFTAAAMKNILWGFHLPVCPFVYGVGHVMFAYMKDKFSTARDRRNTSTKKLAKPRTITSGNFHVPLWWDPSKDKSGLNFWL